MAPPRGGGSGGKGGEAAGRRRGVGGVAAGRTATARLDRIDVAWRGRRVWIEFRSSPIHFAGSAIHFLEPIQQVGSIQFLGSGLHRFGSSRLDRRSNFLDRCQSVDAHRRSKFLNLESSSLDRRVSDLTHRQPYGTDHF